jgi:hypothetical protein
VVDILVDQGPRRDYVLLLLRSAGHGRKLERELNITPGCAQGVLGSHVLEHDRRGGDVFELLADLFADARAVAAESGPNRVLGGGVLG